MMCSSPQSTRREHISKYTMEWILTSDNVFFSPYSGSITEKNRNERERVKQKRELLDSPKQQLRLMDDWWIGYPPHLLCELKDD